MKWMAAFLATLTVGCTPSARMSSPALEQAELECAGKGMATLATPAGNTTTYSCIAPEDAARRAQAASGN
ncbi:MAG TPA: hypothetical protein VEK10_02735 [Steroidobacteraceae bacterium]|nr:hypothetical protein [Steroidobacteraceae bacterium]